ncbi:MAG: flagellar basal body rod protein FlgB [Zetaproteobacteria bacterium]|nr:MAG: flagellar basal body rod protein FlgB [Zetaproteobacteria bacterium]
MGMTLFGGTFAQLEAVAVAREKAQAVFSSNIANTDTPNYKADRRTFADFLDSAVRTRHPVALYRSDPRHMDFSTDDRRLDLGGVFHHEGGVNTRMDGNSVDLQQQMVEMAKNQMLHDLSVRLLKQKLSGLRNAIREGR